MRTQEIKLQNSKAIKEKALELGFEACGIASAAEVDPGVQAHFDAWLDSGKHGKMQYMENHRAKRMDPSLLVENAKSVICLAFNYHHKDFQPTESRYKISQYATGKDYHYVLKEKLFKLVSSLAFLSDDAAIRVFTDSAPVLERYWAQKAGLGWMGKNACLILPGKGSFFFLAEIITTVDLEYDEPFSQNYCGNCHRCMAACPTGAIEAPGQIDARKCLSYLTIELKEPISDEFAGKTEGYVFGCDICQNVCPHNIQFARQTQEPDLEALLPVKEWQNQHWESLSKSDFKKQFVKTKSPIARISFEKLRNNMGFSSL